MPNGDLTGARPNAAGLTTVDDLDPVIPDGYARLQELTANLYRDLAQLAAARDQLDRMLDASLSPADRDVDDHPIYMTSGSWGAHASLRACGDLVSGLNALDAES